MIETLNQRQKSALRYFASGMSQTMAGRRAGYSVNCASQMVNKLLKRKDAQTFLATVNQTVETLGGKIILDVTSRKQHLSDIVTSQSSTPSEAMAAIDLLNKMEGLYVTKVQADVRHTGGIMQVPVISLSDWEKGAAQAQAKLMEEAIDV